MNEKKWPKILPALMPQQQEISDDFMRHWHEVLAAQARYSVIEKFNHGYVVKHAPENFLTTLEIGAGLGEHIGYERLSDLQKKNYVAVELRENMAEKIREKYPNISVYVGDCQKALPFADDFFDRILAIHVLEHLPDLPSAIKEIYRLCNKSNGLFSIVIPCEGGAAYSLARKFSAKRIFENRYNQPYKWFIEREHINIAYEILDELKSYFYVAHRSFFPLLLPVINFNLCIGLTLRPLDAKQLQR